MLNRLFAIGAVQMLAMVALLVRTKGLALLLGPELVGILAVIDKVVAVLVQTASLSLPFAALRFLPGLWDVDRQEFCTRLRAMSLTLVGLSVLATLIGVTVAIVDPRRWGAELQPHYLALLLAFLTIPVQALVPFIQNAAAARFGAHRAMLFYLAYAVVFTVSGVIGAWWRGLEGIYALYGLSGMVLIGLALVDLNAPVAGLSRLPRLTMSSLRMPREVWRFGLSLFALVFLAPYAALSVHYRVLTEVGPEAAGWMQAAMGIALAVRTVIGAAHPVFLTPSVNRSMTAAARMEWAGRFQESLCLLTGIVLPPLLLFPDLAVRVLYTAAFQPGAQFVFVFVLIEVVALLAGTYQAVVLALDHLGFHVLLNLVAQLLLIGIGWVSIPVFGIWGAGIAALSAQVFLYSGTTAFLSRSLSLRPGRRTRPLSLYLVGILLLAGVVGLMHLEWKWASLTVRFTLYPLCVAGLLTFLTRDELLAIRTFSSSLRHRLAAGLGR